MSFLKDIKPATKVIALRCFTAIVITFLILAAYTGYFGVLLDRLFGLTEVVK